MLTETNFSGIGVPRRGKVRDVYDLSPYLLIVATDRISAFDVVMPTPIPSKGETLTGISTLWFKKLAAIVPNHFVTCNVRRYPEVCQQYAKELEGRSMLVKKTTPMPVECVVRGYLSGSAWKDYKEGKPTCGVNLTPGLKESDKLPTPIFTPTTKAESGHDQPITYAQMTKLLGEVLASEVLDASLLLYIRGATLAERAGIIIADTKFEFGRDEEGNLMLIDELLTPDSSRFWPAYSYKPGGPQPSFDKQYLRDYLISIGWNQKPPAPPLPPEIVDQTARKYAQAYDRLKKVLAP